ncbi:MAG: hypothetical protein Kow0063_16370 [Anaerolineae bacterium]
MLPSLYELLDQLGFITRELAVMGLFITGSVIVLAQDWRASLLGLLGQYLLAGLVLSRLVLPEVALIKVLVGALICPMLYLAARQAGWGVGRNSLSVGGRRDIFPAGPPFRLLAIILVGLLAVALNRSYPLPIIPSDVGLGSYWLMLNGLLIMMLTGHPLKAGQGLLTGIIGFELLYSPIERSLAMVWLLAVVNLLLALAIAYLTVARDVGPSEGDT